MGAVSTYALAMPMSAPSPARAAQTSTIVSRRTVETATLSTKFGAFVRGAKMERVRGCVLRSRFAGASAGSWFVSGASSCAGVSGAFFFRDAFRRSSPWALAMDILL